MKVLTNAERVKLITYLGNFASDQILLDAVSDTIGQISHSKSEYKRLASQLNVGRETSASEPDKKTEVKEDVLSTTESEGPEPPGTAAGRIGAKSLAEIKAVLSKGPLSPRDINAGINGKTDNTNALLKLLWTRKVLKWDGTRYDLI